ncbi:glutamine synthetase family protein [Ancylobacter mangrovi]|uniref:glutamine synthetase family protein n=1 Tax=Ancylobacter mangrovi TaxID=2972472 RepID=UPI002163F4F7|nr:glutamine synthetase family protein [Ancylobacter mangrovi]MCS0504349.1 glutamine synthetase family protein [Ancylobacter mangrovi]
MPDVAAAAATAESRSEPSPALSGTASAAALAGDEFAAHVAAHGVPDIVEVLLPDTHGVLRGKWIPGAAGGKIWSDGVAIPLSIFGLDVWGREVEETGIHIETGDRDGICRPVPGTLKPVPWAPRPSAQVMLTMYEPDERGGELPWELDPRHKLARQVERLAARGLHPCVAFELEFYLMKPAPGPGGLPEPVFPASPHGPARQNMYSMSDLDAYAGLLHAVRQAAAVQGLPADTVISEAAPGQYEVNLYHRTDAMAAADDAILLRRLIDGVARQHGLRASFMAKPFLEFAGSGMHVHVSLADTAGGNAFGAGEEGEALLRHAAAGLLATMAPTAVLYVPSYNGFRRLVPGSYAPTGISWGYDNRSVAVRVPNGPAKARRLEHRIAGADAHPHLVLAAILAGMLEGIENAMEPPAPLSGNAYEAEAPLLTYDMGEAVHDFAASDFVARAFGAEYQRVYAVMKEAERAAFERRISTLEYETYL